jgi:NADH-quinone oxidoreductase subunit K
MSELTLLTNYLVVGAILFAVGLIGFLVRRNMIVMFLCTEMMLQGVSLSLAGWGRYHSDWGGQSLVLFIITVAACEAAIALALVLMLVKRAGSLDVTLWQGLREAGCPEFVDHEIPEDSAGHRDWPILTPAGLEPDRDEEERLHRSQI